MGEVEGREKVALDPRLDFFAGTVAGVAALIVGHPFDTVKVRFQNPATSVKYRSTFQAIATIAREERFLGLYKGIASPLASAPVLNGLLFATYRFLMKFQLRSEGQTPTIGQIFIAGAGCGFLSSTITTPIELLKIRQQQSLQPARVSPVPSGTPPAPSTRALAIAIFKERGIPGLYRGITATALRDVGFGAYFASYEGTLRLLTHLQDQHPGSDEPARSLPWFAPLLAGGVAGVLGWLNTFPFDVVKTRVQGSPDGALPYPTSSIARPYRNTWSTIAYSYRTEGAGVFFRGLAPTLIRAIPVNMVTFATFEAVVHTLS